jgi:hypothetical protein
MRSLDKVQQEPSQSPNEHGAVSYDGTNAWPVLANHIVAL